MAHAVPDSIATEPRRTRNMVRPALASWLVAAAVILAGCAPSPAPSPSPISDPTVVPASPAPSPGEATPRPGAFSLDLPAGWLSVPVAGDHATVVASARTRNPALADSLAARLAHLADTTTYFAFDASPSAVTNGILVTLVVTEVPLPLDVSLETFAVTAQRQVEQLVETDVMLRRVLVTAGQAYSLSYVAPLTRPDGETAAVALTQVFYVLPGRGYVMTFAVPPDQANAYAQAIAGIVTSFAIRI